MSEEPKEPFRAFTVRVPLSQYIEMSVMARSEKVHLNKKVTQLLLLGMDKHVSLDDALRRLVGSTVVEDKIDE